MKENIRCPCTGHLPGVLVLENDVNARACFELVPSRG